MQNSNHAIHQIDKYARNRNNLNNCICLGGYEYSTTSSGTIIESLSLSSDVNFNFFNSVLQHKAGYSTEDFSDYLLTSTSKSFLSKLPNTSQKIQLGQYHTVSFLNGKHYLDSEVTSIKIERFDSNNSSLGVVTINNTETNGGAPFGSSITGSFFTQTGGDNTEEGLLYFGCGTNIANSGYYLANVAYYTVAAYNDTTRVSKEYRFDIVDADCKGFETIRLAFLNSLGAWDYYNFTKKSIKKDTNKQDCYKTKLWHYTIPSYYLLW